MASLKTNTASEKGGVSSVFSQNITPAWAAWAVRLCAAVAVGVGVSWLLAWLVGAAPRWSMAGLATVKTNMALAQILGGAALLLLRPERASPARRALGALAAFFTLTLGLLTLFEHLFGTNFGIDQILTMEPPGAAATANSNRMGPPGAAALAFLGAGLLALTLGRQRVSPYLALAACLVQLVPAVGFLYGIEEFHDKPHLTEIAWPTLAALLALGVGLFLARPGFGPLALLLRQDPGGRLVRRVFPVIVFLPLLLGYLAVEAQRHGLHDSAIGTGMLVIALVLVLSVRLWLSAAHLSRAAAAQAKAENQSRQHQAVLEGINRILEGALTCDTEEALGRTCLDVAQAVTGSKFGFLGEINAQGKLDNIALSDAGWAACQMNGRVASRVVPGGFEIHGIYGRVVKDGNGLFTNEPASHPDSIGCPEDHPKLEAFLGAPLLHEGRTIGMIGLANRDGGYREEHLHALEALAPAVVQVFMRRRAEQELRKSNERRKVLEAVTAERQRFNDVLNMLPAYVVLLSPDYHVSFANRFFEERFGKSDGKRCFEYLFNRTKPCDNCQTYYVLKTHAPQRWEWTGPDGRNYDIYDFPFTDADGSELIMEVGLDVTDVKRAEAALKEANERLEQRVAERTAALCEAKEQLARANEQLERKVQERTAKLQELVGDLEHFSYTLIHDMRAPLRAMRGFAQLMMESCAPCDKEQPKLFLERIITSSERMDWLITDALNFTKAVRQELPLEPVDAAQLLRGMLDSYPELQPSRAHIKITGDIPLVMGNQAGLTQCFSNLLGNAVKFVTPGQLPEVSIRAERRGASVRLWFEDRGIGIPPEALDRVFDMFHRAHKDYQGTGIGLALVRKVTQRMGGRVGVESEVGKGSKFWIELQAYHA